uniref:Uncharacterized protein n=1 Tax=Cacopsylla melanoneura TaxID=428564 RepID=A0A8D8W448_9HEMI
MRKQSFFQTVILQEVFLTFFGRREGKKRRVDETLDEFDEEEDELDIDISSTVSGENSMLKDSILYYICGFIVRKIIKKIPCLNCKASLVLDKNDHTSYSNRVEHTQLVHLKDHGGLVRVSQDVFRTVQLAEKVLFVAMNKENLSDFNSNFVAKCIIFVKNELSLEKIFEKCQDVSDFRCHNVELIKLVCKMYYKISSVVTGTFF